MVMFKTRFRPGAGTPQAGEVKQQAQQPQVSRGAPAARQERARAEAPKRGSRPTGRPGD